MSNEQKNETPEQRAKRLGVPYVAPHKPLPIVNGNPVIAVCGGCGRDVHYMEGYSCPKTNCPITNRPTFLHENTPSGFVAFDKQKGGLLRGELFVVGAGIGSGLPGSLLRQHRQHNSAIQGAGVDMVKDNPEAKFE